MEDTSLMLVVKPQFQRVLRQLQRWCVQGSNNNHNKQKFSWLNICYRKFRVAMMRIFQNYSGNCKCQSWQSRYQFVAQRLAQIMHTCDVSQLKHVSHSINTEDVAIGGNHIGELRGSEWVTGSAWSNQKMKYKSKWIWTLPQKTLVSMTQAEKIAVIQDCLLRLRILCLKWSEHWTCEIHQEQQSAFVKGK